MKKWIDSRLANPKVNFFKGGKNDTPARWFADDDKDGVPNVFDCQPHNPKKQDVMDILEKVKSKVKKYVPSQKYQTSRRAAMEVEGYRQRLEEARSEKARKSLQRALDAARKEAAKKKFEASLTGRIQAFQERSQKQMTPLRRYQARERTLKRAARLIYPQIPASATKATYEEQSKKQTGRIGRPRGSFKYFIPGKGMVGVYEWRRWASAQRTLAKIQAIQGQQAQQLQNIRQGVKPTEQMSEEELVAEEEGQAAPQAQVPQVQQMQMHPQQMAQAPPQQYPQQMQQSEMVRNREIIPVFRSSGGKPYPAVDTRPLQGTRDSDYFEEVDSFTGQRRLVRRPQPEAWIRPKL